MRASIAMTVLRINLTTEDTENTEKGIEAKHTSPNIATGIVLKMSRDSLKNSNTAKHLEPYTLRLGAETHR
jgi:hypothetical protein